MIQLTKNEIELIEAAVRRRGITSHKILSEIIDHVACATEQKLPEGLDFSQALKVVMAGFGKDGIRIIQYEHNTLLQRKRKRQLLLTTPLVAVLMFIAIVVNAGGGPDIRPFQHDPTEIKESFSENINGYLYDVTGKLNIYATASGKVAKIIPVSGIKERKFSIILKHKHGYTTIYANLQILDISSGQYVEKGKKLGVVYSPKEGDKVFFAYKILNAGKPVDPQSYY